MNENFILVVEDDPILRMMTRKQIIQLGYKCETVSSGEEALNKDPSTIALIFMDIGLPGIDGVATSKRIREREEPAINHVPIIALTAHSERQHCLEAGMDDFLQKPALIADIKGMLEKWLPPKLSS